MRYNIKRNLIKASWNKYNIFNLSSVRIKWRNKKIKKKIFLAKQDVKKYYGVLDKELKKKRRLDFFFSFEKRLDVVLFRLFFSKSLLESKKILKRKNVFVNYKLITNPFVKIKKGDIIQIRLPYNFHFPTKFSIFNFFFPLYFEVNYNTMTAICKGFPTEIKNYPLQKKFAFHYLNMYYN